MIKKCAFLFLLLSFLIILRPRALCDFATKELDRAININARFLQSIKEFITINFIISKNLGNSLNNGFSENTVRVKRGHAKARKQSINNFCKKNKNSGVYDIAFPNVPKKVTKYILSEYLDCRVWDVKSGQARHSSKGVGHVHHSSCHTPLENSGCTDPWRSMVSGGGWHASCPLRQSSGQASIRPYGPTQDERGVSTFDWCVCKKARASTRLYLVLHIINELESRDKNRDRNRDKNKELVYVSFGSGKLLQDYLIIKGLIAAGFKNINVNLIDLGYANSFDVDIDAFFKTYCKYNGEPRAQDSSEEHDALRSFCELIKSCKCVKVINSYTTYFDFLQKWGKKPVDILLLVDPMSLRAELLNSRDPVYANHACLTGASLQGWQDMAGRANKFSEVIFLLPYTGKPKIFYKGCMDKSTKDYLQCCCDFYNNYGDREDFVRVINNMQLNPDSLLRNGKLSFDFVTPVNISQSQRFSFYDIIKSTVSENALIYQLDNNKIYFGKLNLLKGEYEKEGYRVLK